MHIKYGHSKDLCHWDELLTAQSVLHKGKLQSGHLTFPLTGSKHSTQTSCCCREGPIIKGSSDIISSRGLMSLVATTTRPFSLVNKILYGRHIVSGLIKGEEV